MSQVSSQSVANGAGSAVRAAINSLFAALFSSNSGPAAPSPTVAGMWWFDTTNLIMKRRNNANTAWIDVSLETLTANTLRGNPTGSAAVEQEVSMSALRTMQGYGESIGDSGYVRLYTGGPICQWGSVVGTTNGAGSLSITYPLAFPTASRKPILCNGDNGAVVTCSVSNASITTTGFTLASTLASASLRGNYIVWGN